VRAAPELVRVVVAIDPAVSTSEYADETGIVVVGRGTDGLGYLLADLSGRYTPDGWARRAVDAFRAWEADRIVAEVNNGGDLVETTLRTVDPLIPYRAVHASRGKRTRAEPVAALYEQGRVHHVGPFPDLEDQLCAALPEGGGGPDDRLDALVYGITELDLAGSAWEWWVEDFARGVWHCPCGQKFGWFYGRRCGCGRQVADTYNEPVPPPGASTG
jgi:phage terminase large subunit-like protein